MNILCLFLSMTNYDVTPVLPSLRHESMKPASVSPRWIQKFIEKRKVFLGVGPDSNNPEVLKNTCDFLSEFINLNLSQSLPEGCLPSNLRWVRLFRTSTVVTMPMSLTYIILCHALLFSSQ